MDMEDTNVKMIIAVNGVKHVELIDVKKAMFMIQRMTNVLKMLSVPLNSFQMNQTMKVLQVASVLHILQ